MIRNFSVPRGTADILPDESLFWQIIEAKSREILTAYNYREIRTPVFEETELFARSVGQTSDIVQKQMLSLAPQDKEAGGEKTGKSRVYSLRPEGTAAIVRSYIQNHFERKERLSKFYYIGPMFRGERPQKGRLRQFHQVGAEAIGPDSCSPYLDAEMIGICSEILRSLGLKEFIVKINTLGSKGDKENFSKYLRKEFKNFAKDLCEDCQARISRNVFRVLDCKNKKCRDVSGKIGIDRTYLSEESLAYYQKVKEALTLLGVSFKEDPCLVRGLDYYNHTVFEICNSTLGSQDALGAGGRYNQLVGQLGGPEVDAVGFALGIERIILAVSPKNLSDVKPLDVFLVAIDGTSFQIGFKLLDSLRKRGYSCDMAYSEASMKSQMRQANKLNARHVLIVGQDEVKKGIVTIKDMQTGEQRAELVKNLSKCKF